MEKDPTGINHPTVVQNIFIPSEHFCIAHHKRRERGTPEMMLLVSSHHRDSWRLSALRMILRVADVTLNEGNELDYLLDVPRFF
jgi:hypothetical protein